MQPSTHIKRANARINYTAKQLRELQRCASDPIYFMRQFVKVQHPTKGAVDFNLHNFQVQMVAAFNTHRFNISLASRQIGKTAVAAAFLLWKAMFSSDFTVLITANNFNQALEIMERVRYAYEGLPNHIRAGIREYNKSSITFDNHSRIISRATTSHAGRGLSISLLYVDEFAAIPPNIAKSFWTAIRPTLANGGSCIITSTPLSDEDQFAQIWKGAIDNRDGYGNILPGGLGRNEFFATKFTWRDHPDRDEKWAETERNSLGPVKFRVEHECLIHNMAIEIQDPLGNSYSQNIGDLYHLLALADK